jgi:enterobactin synthetase component D
MATAARSPALFPGFVAQHSVSFDPDEPGDLAEEFPGVELPEALGRAVRKRQAEFLAARYCARQALAVIAPEHAQAVIGIGRNREPMWPGEIVGAITHVHRFASVAVARRGEAAGIGLDVERIMTEKLAGELCESIAGREELAGLARQTGWSAAVVLTLVFSAKETIFKCLYPQVGRYFDFREAEVLSLDPESGRFAARLLRSLTADLVDGYTMEGRFERDEARVCTAMVLPP